MKKKKNFLPRPTNHAAQTIIITSTHSSPALTHTHTHDTIYKTSQLNVNSYKTQTQTSNNHNLPKNTLKNIHAPHPNPNAKLQSVKLSKDMKTSCVSLTPQKKSQRE